MTIGTGWAAVLGWVGWSLLPACQKVAPPAAEPATTTAASRSPVTSKSASASSLTIAKPGLYPETVVYDSARQRFVVGSFREGALYAVDSSGNASKLVDDAQLTSVLGIALDSTRRRVWAVSADLGVGLKQSRAGSKAEAAVGVYDVDSGKLVRFLDLAPLVAGPHLLNGLALDGAGNAYITDSFARTIYRVTADGSAQVLVTSDDFGGTGVNLNGLIVHPNGYLLVLKKSDGSLFRVPLAQPSHFTRVTLDRPLVGADGLLMAGPQLAVVVANKTPAAATNAVLTLASSDDWATAALRAEHPLGDVYPTTATFREGELYVVHTHLDELLQSSPAQRPGLQRSATLERIDDLQR